MSNVTFDIADSATPELRFIAAQLKNPAALHKDLGRRLANDLRKHFRARDASQPNKLGGRRTHFWSDVRDSVQQEKVVPGGVDVVIAHPAIAGKVFGAVITPKNASALTIPVHALAHGRRASVFEDEEGVKLFRPRGRRVLMADLDDGGPVTIYVLAKRVTQSPDDEALPDRAQTTANLLATGRAHLLKKLKR